MKDKKDLIPYQSFPDMFASESEKQTLAYGLKVGQAIQYEWFKKEGNQNSRFYNQWQEFHKRRLYARGEQSVAKYKNELGVDGDLSFLNLDWTPVPILPKFVDIVVNGMSDRMFNIKAAAQDPLSAEKRTEYQEAIEMDMVSKDILYQIQGDMGVDPFIMDPEKLPSNDQELELHMQLNYKPAIEIAEEISITTVLEDNRYADTRRRIDYDLAVLGIGVARHEFLPGQGIRVRYVDPVNVVYSYTEDPYFRDCFYWGEVKAVHITELRKIKPDITPSEIENISRKSSEWHTYHQLNNYFDGGLNSQETVSLLNFEYKTEKKFVYKKKKLETGGDRIVEKDDQFNPPQELMEEGRFEKVEKTVEVWYTGVMVLGSNEIITWELMENMVRPKSAMHHAMPGYVACAPRMYKGNIESLVRRMIPFADLIQVVHLKMQQVISRMVPDGVFIDADGINEVDLGNGASYNPEDALRMYFQTGSVIGRSFTQDGEFNNARIPIQELRSTSGQDKLNALINNYNHYLDMIRGVTGLNEARDASMPDAKSLVGVQKMAALNSNTATRHILDGSLYILNTIAEGVALRVSDLLEYDGDMKDRFISQVGRYNSKIIGEIKDLYLYDFGIFIEVAPDEEERQKLEENIQVALASGNIDIEDAIDIRDIKNIKLANQLLKVRRKQKLEQAEQQAMMQQQMQAQMQMQAQQAKMQSEVQAIQLETESKIQLKEAESVYEIQKMEAEARLKGILMKQEFEYNMQLNGATISSQMEKEAYKEDRKDKRIDKQSTNTSKIAAQKKNNLPPMRFESSEDHMGGIGFGDVGSM